MSLIEVINNEDPLIVDVREPYEFMFGHVKGAINIPLGTIPDRIEELKAARKPVVLYCRTGFRSGQAAIYLKENGIERAYNGINKKEIQACQSRVQSPM